MRSSGVDRSQPYRDELSLITVPFDLGEAMVVKCKKCGGQVMERMPRLGFYQMYVMAFFGRYPWRCVRCGNISYRTERANEQLSRPY